MDGKHGQTTSGVACHQRIWAAHTITRCRAWHAIIAFGLDDTVRPRRAWHNISALGRQTRSNNVGRGMQTSPLGSTDGRTASGVACHHRLWEAHTVERHQAWNAIIALRWQTRSNDVRRGMPSSPLGSTHSRTTSGIACHHRLWEAHTVERCRAWHAIIASGLAYIVG